MLCGLARSIIFFIMRAPDVDVDVSGKQEQAYSPSLPYSKTGIRNNLIQLLVYYTSGSGSLNFGMIIINYFLVTPKFR